MYTAMKCVLNQNVLKTYIKISYCLAPSMLCSPSCKLLQGDNLEVQFLFAFNAWGKVELNPRL